MLTSDANTGRKDKDVEEGGQAKRPKAKERQHGTVAQKQSFIMATILYLTVTGMKASILLKKKEKGRSREK